MISRRKSSTCSISSVKIGSGFPIAIQSMTNTDTADIEATVQQAIELLKAGAELIRVTVNNEEAAKSIPSIKEKLIQKGYPAPLIGDFHFNGHILLTQFPACAQALDKYRINPGNVGTGDLHEKNFRTMIETAIKYQKPVRIGVNWGSLDRELLTNMMHENGQHKNPKSDREVLIEALVESVLSSAKQAEHFGLARDKIVLSVKTSDVQAVINAYELLAQRCDYPLHIGLTEAGMGLQGVVSSTAALSVLLQKGIGDTIRVSITPEDNVSRIREVEVCQKILQSLGIRQFYPSVTSCPGCGRTGSDLFLYLTSQVEHFLTEKMPQWKREGRRVENLKVAIMGCVVNGPGEAKHADISLSLPGKSEQPIGMVFVKGKLLKTLRSRDVGKEFLEILEKYVESTNS